jgi:hypothetical protein
MDYFAPTRLSGIIAGCMDSPHTMFLKCFAILTHVTLNNPVALGFVGLLNRLSGRRLITSVFLVYPAREIHIRNHTFGWMQSVFRVKPALLGFFLLNRRLTVVLSLTVLEADIFKFSREELQAVSANLGRVQHLLGAPYQSMAGILPSLMLRAGVITSSPQRDGTVGIVCAVVKEIFALENMAESSPVVVVGAQGHIGAGLCDVLARTRSVIGLDKDDDVALRLAAMEGPHLVLNVASYAAWTGILNGLQPGAVVLNEVYPPPTGSVREVLKERATVYHVSGVKTTLSVPRLAQGYSKVMPCCAATGDPSGWQPKFIRL